jgi:methionine-rich copper-binding protein CopC
MMAAMPGMDHGSMPGMDHGAMAPNTPPAKPGAPPAMVMTEPTANATVKGPVPMIHVMFNGPVDPKASKFDVTRADGSHVDVGEALPMGATMLMAMPKAALPAGKYRVKWRTVASAKTIEGEFSFSVQ